MTHPLERDTLMFAEMTFCIKELGMPYDQYLRDTSKEMRITHMLWYQLHNAKQSYANTPPDKREFFGLETTRISKF